MEIKIKESANGRKENPYSRTMLCTGDADGGGAYMTNMVVYTVSSFKITPYNAYGAACGGKRLLGLGDRMGTIQDFLY